MTVEQRLDQLERRNKRLTVALTMMAVTMAAVVTMAATGLKDGHFDTVTARKILVKNGAGHIVVSVSTDEWGKSTVEAQTISLKNYKGDSVVRLGSNTGTQVGDGYVSTSSVNGRPLVLLGSTNVGDGAVVTRSAENGKKLVELTSNSSDGVVLVNDNQGRLLVQLGPSYPDSDTSVLVSNKTGVSVVSMGADADGNGAVGVWNRKGKGRTLLQPGP